jgi:hypothetical protein
MLPAAVKNTATTGAEKTTADSRSATNALPPAGRAKTKAAAPPLRAAAETDSQPIFALPPLL